MTLLQRAISDVTVAARSSGVLPPASTPAADDCGAPPISRT
jgi:hypothetical protein